MKTSELTGTALGWAVATADGRQWRMYIGGGIEVRARSETGEELPEHWDLWYSWFPQTAWSQGGPLIQRAKLTLTHQGDRWGAQTDDDVFAYGPTPLIAAMRCYVASQLGDEVDIPSDLL